MQLNGPAFELWAQRHHESLTMNNEIPISTDCSGRWEEGKGHSKCKTSKGDRNAQEKAVAIDLLFHAITTTYASFMIHLVSFLHTIYTYRNSSGLFLPISKTPANATKLKSSLERERGDFVDNRWLFLSLLGCC